MAEAATPPVIHPTAVVDPDARLGSGTVVWSHVCIAAGAVLGSDCKVGHGAYVDRGVQIGHRCWIHNHACIYRPVSLGDDVFVGPHVVFVNDPDPTFAHTRDLSGTSWHVSQGATIGANATIMSDVNLAPYCFIAAGAVVTADTVPYGLYVGVPARLKGYRCACGQRYSLTPGLPARCAQCNRAF